ncbi:hypothetical protein C8R44DRAFT_821013, partial [Mycena epipterygia]
MRFLYHRAVLEFMKKNRDTPLSEEIVHIYESYLAFEYVTPRTKTMILWEFWARASRSQEDAHAIVNSSALDQVTVLLESPSSRIREEACWLVGNLSAQESTAVAVLALKPCLRLVALL